MRNVARGFVYASGLGLALWLNPAAAGAQDAPPAKPAAAATAKPPATIASKTAALKKLDGFMPLYWDENDGKLLMEIGQFDTELLYQVSLPAGVGYGTLETKANFVRPISADTGTLRCEGKVLAQGRTILTAEAKLTDAERESVCRWTDAALSSAH